MAQDTSLAPALAALQCLMASQPLALLIPPSLPEAERCHETQRVAGYLLLRRPLQKLPKPTIAMLSVYSHWLRVVCVGVLDSSADELALLLSSLITLFPIPPETCSKVV